MGNTSSRTSPRGFILNQQVVTPASLGRGCADDGAPLVDIIRNSCRLKGTTVACREGDCGACTVLVGEWQGDALCYRTITSCISPLANAWGKHIVTIEGLGGVNPMQEVLASHGATQCGYCTPGFVVSLAGYLLRATRLSYAEAISGMDGNICRCTGYKSIERAVASLIADLQQRLPAAEITTSDLVAEGLVPAYFLDIANQLQMFKPLSSLAKHSKKLPEKKPVTVIGGGTDLWVQRPRALLGASLYDTAGIMAGVSVEGTRLVIGGATRLEDFKNSPIACHYIPRLPNLMKFFASTQIRQQATIAGNIVNASPIGDLSNLFLALDAELTLTSPAGSRQVALKKFYKAYKLKDMAANEVVTAISCPLPDASSAVNLEKVSRRKFLDIASVTSSMHLKVDGGKITHASFSAGGVGPYPLYLERVSAYCIGKSLTPATVRAGVALAQDEVSPISDVRGSVGYKRLLLRQLLYAHFITCYPDLISMEALAL